MKLCELMYPKEKFDVFYSGHDDINEILDGFDRYTYCNINKRDNCGPVALDLVTFLKDKGIEARRVEGYFLVDKADIGKKSFLPEEIKDMISKGFNFSSDIDRQKYAESSGIIDELRKIPHYWVITSDGAIIDPTIRQFAKFMTGKISVRNYVPK